MSIPLVQDNNKDSINTSIIAIKRHIERINMLLGLVDSGGSNPDLSGLATKQELQDAITELSPVDEVTLNNMQSVTSNAVSKAMSYSTEEHFTGKYWIDGKKIYECSFPCNTSVWTTGNQWSSFSSSIFTGLPSVGGIISTLVSSSLVNNNTNQINGVSIYVSANGVDFLYFTGFNINTSHHLSLLYTKTTD